MNNERPVVRAVPWLDDQSQRALSDALGYLLERRSDVQAAVLYGSVARRTARPLSAQDPSDIDVLILFQPEPGYDSVSSAQRAAVAWAIVETIDRYPEALPLDLMPTLCDLSRWDESFVANVARDGFVLWQKGDLPDALRALDTHQIAS